MRTSKSGIIYEIRGLKFSFWRGAPKVNRPAGPAYEDKVSDIVHVECRCNVT
jgi:hypothetical protein